MSHLIRTWRHGRQLLSSQRGQSLVEFALLLPVLALVIFGLLKLGIAATSWSDETHLASEAARYAVVNSCSACGGQPIDSWILSQADTGDLKTHGTATITFTGTSAFNHCVGAPVQVTVSYTYSLLDLNFPSPLPSLPKWTTPITATSTQRLEKNWGDASGNKTASDAYNAFGSTHDLCP
jgi:Flp pilus assembly protein TadG